MSEPSRPASGSGLPRRDYLILPLLSLFSMLLVLGGAELLARAFYADGQLDACLMHDSVLGVRFRPNCTAMVKLPESPWVTNRYNECGYRTAESCGTRAPGTLRLAVIGSSVAFGLYVPYRESITARLGEALTAACGQPVQVQNLASEYEFWGVLRHRFDLAAALKPDGVIVVVAPTDVETQDPELRGEQNALPPVELMTRVRNLFTDSRLRIVAQHFLYRNPRFYLSLYRNSVAKTLYMRDPLSSTLRLHVEAYERILEGFAERARSGGFPVMLAFVPQRAQVGFAADAGRPDAIDPFALNHALAASAARAGADFVDTTPDLVADPRQMDLFLRSDGHLDADGDGVVASALARHVVRDLPRFSRCVIRG